MFKIIVGVRSYAYFEVFVFKPSVEAAWAIKAYENAATHLNVRCLSIGREIL